MRRKLPKRKRSSGKTAAANVLAWKALQRSALKHFTRVDATMAALSKEHFASLAPPRRVSDKHLFASLCESIISQQLSVKASDTIYTRLVQCVGELTPATIREAPTEVMRQCGVSRAKIRALTSLAQASEDGLSLAKLRTATMEDVLATLTTIQGIGPWTAEMFAMFSLNHHDIFSPKDLGLRRGIEKVYGVTFSLTPRVAEKELALFGKRWSPYRTLASRLLWRAKDAKLSRTLL